MSAHGTNSGQPPVFDPVTIFPSLALIRIPKDPGAKPDRPQKDDAFGTGFFVTSDGVLLTVAHNLTKNGTPSGKPLPWVWVCRYDLKTKDWTDCRQVAVYGKLIDRKLDAAVLLVDQVTVAEPLGLGTGWQAGDDLLVVGFQENGSRTSGYSPCPMLCSIPGNVTVAPYELTHFKGELYLRLLPQALDARGVSQALLREGISGGPALLLSGGRSPLAIAIEKAIKTPGPRSALVTPNELRATPVAWLTDSLWPKLPADRQPGFEMISRQPVTFRRKPLEVHPLAPARDFQDRPELDSLRSFWCKETEGGVLAIEGIGGAGKTALVRRFLDELPKATCRAPGKPANSVLPEPDLLFVWSFYHQADSGQFIHGLFSYVCDGRPLPAHPHPCLTDIQQALGNSNGCRSLIVLDGLERIQREHDGFGRCREDAALVRQFLQWAATDRRGVWIVVTSRFPLVDLAEWEGSGYVPLRSGALSSAAARALLRARGVHGGDAELDRVANDYARHALSLAHLGTFLGTFHDGNLAKCDELPDFTDPELVELLGPEAARLARILVSYEGMLRPEETLIMKVISIFRKPIDRKTIGFFACSDMANRFQQRPMPENRLPWVLKRLVELQLIQHQPGNPASAWFSVHPAVGQYFEMAHREDARLIHDGAAQYLRREVGPTEVRAPIRGAVRTRGAAPLRGKPRRNLPSESWLLDLTEEMIYHCLKRGGVPEAYDLYRHALGGYDHLGRTLHDPARGLRLTAMFLPPEPTAPASGTRGLAGILKPIRADHERYRRDLEARSA